MVVFLGHHFLHVKKGRTLKEEFVASSNFVTLNLKFIFIRKPSNFSPVNALVTSKEILYCITA
jgi:hypothetical protein